MGVLAQLWQAQNPQFREKVSAALLLVTQEHLGSNNQQHAKMARFVIKERNAEAIIMDDLLRTLVLGGLDVDSDDAAIKAAVVAAVPILIIQTNADSEPAPES